MKRDTLLITPNRSIKHISDRDESIPFDVRGPLDAILGNRWVTILITLDTCIQVRGRLGDKGFDEWYGTVATWCKPGGLVHLV